MGLSSAPGCYSPLRALSHWILIVAFELGVIFIYISQIKKPSFLSTVRMDGRLLNYNRGRRMSRDSKDF